MRRSLCTFAVLAAACSSARADFWALKPEINDTEYIFGDTRIVLHYDSTRDQSYPKYKLSVYLEGKRVGEHEDVGFEKVFASPDNAFFVGVSNDGLIKDAYVIFDRNGQIVKKQPHDLKAVHYFEISVTLTRNWYDKDDPDARFVVVDGKLKDVRVNACDGASVSLLIREDLRLRAFLSWIGLSRTRRSIQTAWACCCRYWMTRRLRLVGTTRFAKAPPKRLPSWFAREQTTRPDAQ